MLRFKDKTIWETPCRFCFFSQLPYSFEKAQKNNVMSGINYLTREGFERLSNELEDMKSRGRSEAARAIAEAREKGDLSENAEYDAAKEAQGMLELRINDLEKQLANARVLEISDVDISKVTVLSKVTIKNKANNATITYQIVSESESDLKAKRISVSSPMGKGLLGKKIGEVAYVDTPNGKLEFVVENISI
ncbi:MAG: hypothetical protein RLZZ417_1147 [Bacteroidota bacterium]